MSRKIRKKNYLINSGNAHEINKYPYMVNKTDEQISSMQDLLKEIKKTKYRSLSELIKKMTEKK